MSTFDNLPEGAHGIAVALERALRMSGFLSGSSWSGWHIEPPDSEPEPNNFGLSFDGELQYVIRVDPW